MSEVLYSGALLDKSEVLPSDKREEELKFHFLSSLFHESGTVLTERVETIHIFLESLIGKEGSVENQFLGGKQR